MIKFFKRLRFNLMENNKTAQPVFAPGRYLKYAVGEIILVVIGILIALQINNSNNQRIEKTRENKYLKNIKIDLKKDIANRDYTIAFRTEKAKGTDKIIAQIN